MIYVDDNGGWEKLGIKKMTKYKSKYFPFSAGIPWKIERGKYIRPEIDSVVWHQVLDSKNIIITAFGGLFESFFSLSAAEALCSFDPNHKIFWRGNEEFDFFRMTQGLCKICTINLTPNHLKSYPTPIFFDKKDNAYLNLLNNYLVRKSYWGKYPEEINDAASKQIFNNVLVPWESYIPKLRKLGDEFTKTLKQSALIRDHNRVIVIIINDKTDGLNWNVQSVKEFGQLASSIGLKVVVFSNWTKLFYGTKIRTFDYNIRNITQSIQRAWMVLSSDNDWSLISMMMSEAHLISEHVEGPKNLFKNAEFLGSTNDIFTDRDGISPITAFNICQGLL